jgi:hypothetical protein
MSRKHQPGCPCCEVCPTTMTCSAWDADFDGYTPSLTTSWTTIEDSTSSGTTVSTVNAGSCGSPYGTRTITSYFDYSFQYRLRMRLGHTKSSITCGTWPTGFTGPASKTLRAGNSLGYEFFTDGGTCYVVLHVEVEIYVNLVRTVQISDDLSGYTGSFSFCNSSVISEQACGDFGFSSLCFTSTTTIGFTSEPITFTDFSSLTGPYTLYRNPESCSAVGPTYRVALLLPTDVSGLVVAQACSGVGCRSPNRPSTTPWTAWDPWSQNGTALPSTMTLELTGCA